MISLEIVEREISEIESSRDTTYRTCERLAWLYIVRDHIREKLYPQECKTAMRPSLGGSEFLDAASGKPYDDVLGIVDEHLETIRLLYPKTFSALVDKIREL